MKLFKNIFGNLIGTFVYLISLVSPRRSDKICFGGVDNAKYLYLLTDWKKLGIRVYWFSNDNEQVEKMQRLGYNAFLKTSIVGLYHLLTSKVYVITHGISDINKWTCGNVKIVNVFHGLPYKKIGFDDPKHKKSIWKYLLSPTTLKKYDMQLSTSPFVETIF